jgi:hypothetical protein
MFSSRLIGPRSDDLEDFREAAEGVGMIEETHLSTLEDPLREGGRVSGEVGRPKRLSLSLLSVSLPDSAKAQLSHDRQGGKPIDNQPNRSLRACIFGLLAGDGVLTPLSKLWYNLEGAA